MSWKDDINLGPWSFAEQPDKPNSNEGNHIASYDDPVWSLDPSTGVPITPTHIPCGYWTKGYAGLADNPPNDGPIWVAGYNAVGGFGAATPSFSKIFILSDANEYLSVIAGYGNSYTLDASGYLYSTGWNDVGQLGLGDLINRSAFTQSGASTWSKISVESTYGKSLLGMKIDGSVWGTGYNSYGQLGCGDNANKSFHTEAGKNPTGSLFVPGIIATDVAQGYYHSLVVEGGTVWHSGWWSQGACGNGVDSGGSTPYFKQVEVDLGAGLVPFTATKVWAHRLYSFALHEGIVWATGLNEAGNLGLGDEATPRVRFESTGMAFTDMSIGEAVTSFGITASGELWCAGRGDQGQLGLGGTGNVNVFTQTGNGTSDWAAVSCGSRNTIARKTDNSIWATGLNNYGQLGLGDNTRRLVFTEIPDTLFKVVSAGHYHTIAIK